MTSFYGTATGDNTYNGTGTNNTVSYARDTDPQGVIINLSTDTATKGIFYYDSFSDIQNFVGDHSGNSTFESIGTGDYTFTGLGTNNTLSYSLDSGSVIINLSTDTVNKGSVTTQVGNTHPYQDSFSEIQNFVGNSSASDTIDFSGASNQYKIVDNTNGSVTVTDTESG